MGQYLNVVVDRGMDGWISTSMLFLTGVWMGGSVPQCCC